MPRPQKQDGLESAISKIVSVAVSQIAQAFRSTSAEPANGKNGHATERPGVVKRGPKKSAKRNYPPHCIFPRCRQPHGGPRSGFFCSDHVGISKAAKAKIKEARASA